MILRSDVYVVSRMTRWGLGYRALLDAMSRSVEKLADDTPTIHLNRSSYVFMNVAKCHGLRDQY